MKELFAVTVEERDGLPWLIYHFDRRAWNRLQKTLLGKTLLFTDNADWSDVGTVRCYRAQHHVETGFRCMKDAHHIGLHPQHHWTDQKIRVHVFCYVLALMLCSNEPQHRIEMHLVSSGAQTIQYHGGALSFAAGDSIRTEYSCKYSREDFVQLAAVAGWRNRACWTDSREWFSVQYFEVE